MSGHGYTKADERRLAAEVAATKAGALPPVDPMNSLAAYPAETWTPAVGDRVAVAGTVQEIYVGIAIINLGDGMLAAAPVGSLRLADADPV